MMSGLQIDGPDSWPRIVSNTGISLTHCGLYQPLPTAACRLFSGAVPGSQPPRVLPSFLFAIAAHYAALSIALSLWTLLPSLRCALCATEAHTERVLADPFLPTQLTHSFCVCVRRFVVLRAGSGDWVGVIATSAQVPALSVAAHMYGDDQCGVLRDHVCNWQHAVEHARASRPCGSWRR